MRTFYHRTPPTQRTGLRIEYAVIHSRFEAVELVIEAVRQKRDRIIAESADLMYHVLVLWADAGVRPGEVWDELSRREGMSGVAEKAARPKE